MDDRLAELEIRLAFQEKTLQDLNDVVIRQQGQLDAVTRELRALNARVVAAMPSNVASEAEETPPPHY